MANLETLELTINGSAKSASEGIGQLITSLSSLSDALTKPYSDLVDFNKALRETASICKSIKMPDFGKVKGSVATKAKKAEEYVPKGVNVDAVNVGSPNAVPDDVWQKNYDANHARIEAEHQARIQRTNDNRARMKAEAEAAKEASRMMQKGYEDAIKAEREAMEVRGQDTKDIIEQSTKLDLLTMKQEALKMETISMAKEGKLTAKQIADRSLQYQKLGKDIEKIKNQANEIKEATKQMGESAKENIGKMEKPINKVVASAKGLLSTIGRIFKTMLIRQAIRALLKAAKEGLDNYYQYAKNMDLSFGKSMDKVTSKWNQIKNQMGAGLGTALNAVLPILNAIASAALVAFNAITALFALLGGQSTYSRATEQMDNYADSIKGASGAAKDWLASFDELNVMTSGGGGGGGSGTNFGSLFEEVQLPQWLIEWKPILEAIIGGTLGAILLPKIWEWIKKIFDLFGGSGARDTLDILKKMRQLDDTDFDVPTKGIDNFLDKFSSSDILDGVGDVADLLSTIKNLDWKKILVENIPELIQMAIALITKLIQGMDTTSHIKVDKKEFEDFKQEFDAFKQEYEKLGEKAIKVKIDEDVAKITRLTNWVATVGKKTIKVIIDNDVAKITSLNNWVVDTPTKKITIKFSNWTEFIVSKLIVDEFVKPSTKQIRFALYTTEFVLTATVVNEFLKPSTKKINFSIELATFTVVSALVNNWLKDSTKKINISIPLTTYTVTTALIDTWVKRSDTKTVQVKVDTTDYDKSAKTINEWVKDTPTKYINVKLVDNGGNIASTSNWITTTETKTIKVNVQGSASNSSGSDLSLSRLLGMNANQLLNELFGWNLPENGFIPWLINTSADKQSLQDTVDTVTGAAPTMDVKTSLDTPSLQNDVINPIQGSSATIGVKANLTNGSTLTSAIKNAIAGIKVDIKTKVEGVLKKVGEVLTAAGYASGGFPEIGELFIAREAGPEMVGRIGNSTAVANNDQIVAGIANGVAAANAEQNALLRQQNALLTSILNKDSTIRLGASAALGRTVQQSLDMYGIATGGA